MEEKGKLGSAQRAACGKKGANGPFQLAAEKRGRVQLFRLGRPDQRRDGRNTQRGSLRTAHHPGHLGLVEKLVQGIHYTFFSDEY